MSDAEIANRVTPGHRVSERGVSVAVIVDGVTPSDWVNVRGVRFRRVGLLGHRPLLKAGELSKIEK